MEGAHEGLGRKKRGVPTEDRKREGRCWEEKMKRLGVGMAEEELMGGWKQFNSLKIGRVRQFTNPTIDLTPIQTAEPDRIGDRSTVHAYHCCMCDFMDNV